MSEIAQERFTIDSDQKAEWAIDKIREAKADCDRWVDFYREQIDKVKAECDDNIANLEFMLHGYFASRSAEGHTKSTKTQETYNLPGGTLVMKKQQPEFSIDEERLVPWLEQNAPNFVKVKKSAKWMELKNTVVVMGNDVVDENGEIVPGVSVTQREPKFTVTVKTKGE